MIDAVWAFGPTLTTAFVGVIVWMSIRRPMETRDRKVEHLEHEIQDLRDDKMAAFDLRLGEAAGARRGIHQDMTKIRGTFVHKNECKERYEALAGQLAGFNEAVLKLERVGERTEVIDRNNRQILEQLIETKTEIAEIGGQIKRMNGKHDG